MVASPKAVFTVTFNSDSCLPESQKSWERFSVSTFLIKKAGLTRKSGARTGSVTFIQRFGGSLNLNIHFHMMFPEGVYSFKNGRSKFHFTTPPSNRELDKLLTSLVQRVVRFLERRGLIQRDQAFVSITSAPRPWTRFNPHRLLTE